MNVNVLLRVRPLNPPSSTTLSIAGPSVTIDEQNPTRCDSPCNNGSRQTFTYDAIYGPESNQVEIFEGVRGIVDTVCDGFNGTIVAYGQTGSGKTHTIFGDSQDNANAGLIQRSLKAIYTKITESQLSSLESSTTMHTTTSASFFEIYNERVYDLLSCDANDLAVREDANKGVYVEGLTERIVKNTSEAMEVLHCGMENRKVASTNMNRVSSRSHALFVLTVKSEIVDGGITKVRCAKFTLVDLAGSERQKTTDTAGERLKEASMINNSLLCLGQVINSLVDSQRGLQKHAPFRNTKLTFLLRDSFGGNSKTCLVATVTPSLQCLTETISTLQFAQRAKLIKNKAVVNEDMCGSVKDLQAEIARLKAALAQSDGGRVSMPSPGFPPLPPRQTTKSTGLDDAPEDVTVVALRNQNSKLTKTVKSLKETSKLRDSQVASLKRKLQQETLIRKCKERRITYLSSKSAEISSRSQEIAALQEEVTALRDQLENGRNDEAIRWRIKYKEERSRVEELQNDEMVMDAVRQEELESTLTSLLNEKDEMKAKLDSMKTNQNGELDAILKDITKLESETVELQAALNVKSEHVQQQEEKIRSNEVQLAEIQEEMSKTVECLEAAQLELTAEKTKSRELQESLEGMKKEVEDKCASIEEYQDKITEAEDEMKRLNESHAEATTALQTKIADLEKDVSAVMDDNDALMKKMKEATDEIAAKQMQLEALTQEKEEVIKQIDSSTESQTALLEAFKLKEDEFKVELKELTEKIEVLMSEKSEAVNRLEHATAENASMLEQLESFRAENESLQKQLGSIRDIVYDLEDELMLVTEERDDAEAELEFVHADFERTSRFHHNSTAATAVDHDDDLASRDEAINSLTIELSAARTQISGTTQSYEEKIAMLQNEIAYTKEECESATHRMEALNSELETTKDLHAKSVAFIASLENETAETTNAIQAEKEMLSKELDQTKTLLSESEAKTIELANAADEFTTKIVAMEALIKTLEKERDQLNTEAQYLKAQIASGEEAQAHLLQTKEEKVKLESECENLKTINASMNEEVVSLLSKLASIEAENEALKQAAAESQQQAKSELREVTEQKEQLELECNDLRSREAITNEELAVLKAKLLAIETEHESLKAKTSADSEQSKSELLDASSEIERLVAECDALKSREAAASDEISSLKDKLVNAEKGIEALKAEALISAENTQRELLEMKAVKEQLETKSEALKSSEASANEEVASLKDKLATLEKEFEISAENLNRELLQMQVEKEQLETESEALKSSEASANEEVASLKDKLATLEKEYESLKDSTADKFALDVALSPVVASEHVESPHPDQNPANSTFADDSFDESMFLPNAEVETGNNEKTPSKTGADIGESKTPSKTPFKERRALFSPKKSPSKSPTPMKRRTRSSRRAPLGTLGLNEDH